MATDMFEQAVVDWFNEVHKRGAINSLDVLVLRNKLDDLIKPAKAAMTTQPPLTAEALRQLADLWEEYKRRQADRHSGGKYRGGQHADFDDVLRDEAKRAARLTSPAPSPAAGCEPIPTYSDLRDAINLILPMAKGYVAEHPVGSNQEYVDHVVELLSRIEVVP